MYMWTQLSSNRCCCRYVVVVVVLVVGIDRLFRKLHRQSESYCGGLFISRSLNASLRQWRVKLKVVVGLSKLIKDNYCVVYRSRS